MTKQAIKNCARINFDLRNCLIVLLMVVVEVSMLPTQSVDAASSESSVHSTAFSLNRIKSRPKPSLALIRPTVSSTANPTDASLTNANFLPEPLFPTSETSLAGENIALAKALDQFYQAKDPEDISSLTNFLRLYPHSRWLPAIALNLGILRFQTGYLSGALAYWKQCWISARQQTNTQQQSIASRAAAELAMLNARLGRKSEASKYIAELRNRKSLGNSGALIEATRQGLTMMEADPAHSFKCGPFAVNTLLSLQKKSFPCTDPLVQEFTSSSRGTNLAQVHGLSKKIGLKFQAAKRGPSAPLVVPCIMHWKTEHFSAITVKSGDKYRVQDPTFGPSSSAWISEQAITAESDGFFLIPDGPLPAGWQTVSNLEAGNVWGKGVPISRNNCKTCEEEREQMNSCTSGGCGMPSISAFCMNATPHIVDTPLQSTPPIGPNMAMTFTYNLNEGNQPSNFSFSNVGVNWSFNWFSYLQADASQNLTVSVPGGGFESFTNSGGTTPSYSPNLLSHSIMKTLPAGGYQRELPDGSTQNYTKALSLSGISYFLMTSYADAQGNAAQIAYDTYNRVSTITDACGNVYSLTYLSGSPDPEGRYLLLSSVSDAFGRSAVLTYDPAYNYLQSIKDAEGNLSTFATTPFAVPHILSVTTPYGTTLITGVSGGVASDGTKFQFPDGSAAVILNKIWSYKNTYFWDREAMKQYPLDYLSQIYSHCKRTHWLWEPVTNTESAVPAWTQKALETATFYTYPNQPNLGEIGSTNAPTSISSMLIGNRVIQCDVIGADPATAGDKAILYICDKGLPTNGQETILYTLQTGDTAVGIANALVFLINSNANLSNLGISAVAVSNRIFLRSLSPNPTSFVDDVTSSSFTYTTGCI